MVSFVDRPSELGLSFSEGIDPYLLNGLDISGPDQVWCSDITYVPLQSGFMYLVEVMDWWSRHVLAWDISNTLDSDFCIRAWERDAGSRTSRTRTKDRRSPARPI